MFYKSIHNPAAEASGELIVLSYKDKNVLIPLFQDYQDVLELAKASFHLSPAKSQQCILQTDELNGCDGKWVEIHRDAWTFIRRTLHRVVVDVVPRNEPQLIETNDNASKKTASIAPKQKQANPLTHKQQLLNVGASDLSSSRTTSAASGRISPAQRSVQPRNDSTPKGKSKATHRPLPQPQLQVARSFPRKSVVKNPTLPQPIPIRTYTIGKEDDVIISSPKMDRKRKSPSFQRPDEPENVSISVHASTSIQLKPEESEDEEFVEPEFVLAVEPIETTEDDQQEPEQEPEEPVVKQSPRKRPRLCTLEDVRASPNETFLITIEYGEDEENFRESIFKVKGKHPVQKVLAMACHTLEVDKNDIPKAHLVLIMEDAENGEMMEHRFKCDNANTMADEGAYPEARFFIAIGDDDDD